MDTKNMENQIKEIYRELNSLYLEYQDKDYLSLGMFKINTLERNILVLYREYLSLVLKLQSLNPDKVNNNSLRNSNCYLYALALPVPMIFKRTYNKLIHNDFGFDVGVYSNYKPLFRETYCTKSNLVERLESDLSYFKIDFFKSSIDSKLEHNGYKISLYINRDFKDYHFLRQNPNGIWMDKNGYKGIIKEVTSDHLEEGMDNEGRFYEYVETLEIVKPSLKR